MDSSILDDFIRNRDNALMDWFEENYGEKYVLPTTLTIQ